MPLKWHPISSTEAVFFVFLYCAWLVSAQESETTTPQNIAEAENAPVKKDAAIYPDDLHISGKSSKNVDGNGRPIAFHSIQHIDGKLRNPSSDNESGDMSIAVQIKTDVHAMNQTPHHYDMKIKPSVENPERDPEVERNEKLGFMKLIDRVGFDEALKIVQEKKQNYTTFSRLGGNQSANGTLHLLFNNSMESPTVAEETSLPSSSSTAASETTESPETETDTPEVTSAPLATESRPMQVGRRFSNYPGDDAPNKDQSEDSVTSVNFTENSDNDTTTNFSAPDKQFESTTIWNNSSLQLEQQSSTTEISSGNDTTEKIKLNFPNLQIVNDNATSTQNNTKEGNSKNKTNAIHDHTHLLEPATYLKNTNQLLNQINGSLINGLKVYYGDPTEEAFNTNNNATFNNTSDADDENSCPSVVDFFMASKELWTSLENSEAANWVDELAEALQQTMKVLGRCFYAISNEIISFIKNMFLS